MLNCKEIPVVSHISLLLLLNELIMNKEIKNIYQKAQLMVFHLLLTVSNLYHQTRINEEELLLEDKITAQGTSFAESKVFIKWLQRYSLWPWAKHLISANQPVFYLQNSISSSYLLHIQGCEVLFSSLSLHSGFYNGCDNP